MPIPINTPPLVLERSRIGANRKRAVDLFFENVRSLLRVQR